MHKYLALISFSLLVACSDNNETPAIEDTVFQSQVGALNKAKETERALQDAMERQRQAIEESGG